ncbi:MAG TPA: O-antigen ligase family protein [Chloroflexia bacterium]|nr:O-antigen ligase family protein [Chloroflexia bacterium]
MAIRLENPEIEKISGVSGFNFLEKPGYWCLVLLVFSLPFELTQKPLFSSDFLVVSNLKLIFLLVVALAALTLLKPISALATSFKRGQLDRTNYLYRQRVPLGLFLGLLLACTLSSLLAGTAALEGEGLKWSFHLVLGGLLWLAIPLWLAENTESKIKWLSLALLTGALASACVGFGEFILGNDFAWSLAGWFKMKPTEAGPFLRLSGTFDYANVAGMYFELALPFALTGVVKGLSRGRLNSKARSGILLAVVVVIILLTALLLTLSRGAWLGVVVGIAAMVVASRNSRLSGERSRWWVAIGLTGFAGLGLELIALVMMPQFALRFNSQSDQDWFKASYSGAPPATLNICQELTIPVTVKNLSPLTWQTNSTKPYNLSYHWLNSSDTMAQFEGIRTPLTTSVAPASSISISARIRAPASPGKYSLVWDMVQEDVSWFSLKSSIYTKIPVQVNDLPAFDKSTACDTGTAVQEVARPVPKSLPKVLIQPDRQQLWQAALSMIAHRPLFGVGPNGFRFSYGDYTEPRLTDWDKRIFANSLPLEIFADTGLVGGLLFLALFVAICWRLLLMTWQGQGATVWQVAVTGSLAAFLGHGLLDYILGSNAIFILFWILLGLASTRTRRQIPG